MVAETLLDQPSLDEKTRFDRCLLLLQDAWTEAQGLLSHCVQEVEILGDSGSEVSDSNLHLRAPKLRVATGLLNAQATLQQPE